MVASPCGRTGRETRLRKRARKRRGNLRLNRCIRSLLPNSIPFSPFLTIQFVVIMKIEKGGLMKKVIGFLCLMLLFSLPLRAEEGGIGEPALTKDSGFYVGGDTGVWIFLGNSNDTFGAGFTTGADFGYSLKRYINFQLRVAQAPSSLDRNNSNVFFFTGEFDLKFNLTKTAFTPFVLGGVGFYFVDFGGRDPFVKEETNLNYVFGGGFDYNFGVNSIGLGVNYRGFANSFRDFKALEILVQYSFNFF